MPKADPTAPPRWRLCNRRMVLRPPTGHPLWTSHAQAPTVLPVAPDHWKAFFAGRDARNRSRVYAAELNPFDVTVRTVYPDPVLDLGTTDAFDAHGVGAGTAILIGDRIRLYYSGVRVRGDGSYRTGIGVAESTDGGRSFARLREEPVVGADPADPNGAVTPTVMRQGEGWVMWYSSFWEWRIVDGTPEPVYDIRRAFSADGLRWQSEPAAAFTFANSEEGGLVRTQILREGPHRLLIVASRGWRDFRPGSPNVYRLVYAHSTDGETWTRDPDAIEIDPADTVDGWDTEMRCYPWLVEDGGRRLLFYNGNDFGRHGFGVGELHPVEEGR